MSDSIKVAIRVRPLIKREKDENQTIQWVVQENTIASTDPEMKKRGDGRFCFDHIFDIDASNSDVFNTIVKPIVDAAVNGINGTVFAYGQTSSGKTYSMLGTSQEPGIIPLAIDYMFNAIANTVGREFLLRVSYLELYNERVNDLLNKSNIDLKLKDDGNGQVIVHCKEEITNCPQNVLSLMKKGDKNRRIGETNMNERSSRSHTIFRITIESREVEGDSDGAIQVSQLNLVDLAGSERAGQTGATGERFKEGRHINMSLSTLGLVIMQLSEFQDGQKHVNFRDSKLTRLLQSSLGGNAMTAVICAVTPAALEETQCTLSFACRAKSVKNKPQINEVMSDAALLKRYAKQLSKLQAELQKIKTENRAAEVEEMESKLQEKDRINQLLEERIELLKTRIVSGDTTNRVSFKSNSKRRQTWGGPGLFSQHLPVFKATSSLSTVEEASYEMPHEKNFQSVDIMNQTFQTAFTDFELQLFESERDRESRENATDSDEEPYVTKRRRCVTFRDDVFTTDSKDSISPEKSVLYVTPNKCNTATQTMNYQESPSTPKHILRKCINDLTKEYIELRQFTALEKQLIFQENQCCSHEKEPLKLEKLKIDSNVANAQEITELTELEKQSEHVTSEKDTYEQINAELHAALNCMTTELESKIISEQAEKQEIVEKNVKLEERIKEIVLERNEFERINVDLRAILDQKNADLESKIVSEHIANEEMSKKVFNLEKKISDITKQNQEFQHLNTELNMKVAEMESTVILERTAHQKAIEKISELHREIENMTHDKNEFDRTNTELNQKISELESKIISEQSANQEATGIISKLEKEVRDINSEKKELEHINNELRYELNKKMTELELRNDINDVQNVTNIATEDQDPKHQMQNQSVSSCLNFLESNAETSVIMAGTELEESQLAKNLQFKSLELDEIKISIQDFKQDIENLQSTVCLLTTENMEMATKLTTEQENAKQTELNLQKTIDELYARISEVTIEKINLQDNLATLTEKLETMHFRVPETYNEEQLLATYRNKIDKLTNENIELASSLAEKNNELEGIKESKSLLYNHECIYKDEVTVLAQENKCLQLENVELSTNLIDKIEENDSLREQCDILKSKIEQFQAMNENSVEEDEDHLRSQNNILKAEIVELKMRITILSEENIKFSNNLLQTMECLDHCHNEKSYNTLCPSTIFNNSTENESFIEQDILKEENREILASKVITLQEKINYLTLLNKKLSDLKLTSCSQCTHLKNLSESRRALKLEVKVLNQKLEDLQSKFNHSCVDTLMPKNEISRELNLSECDVSANVSHMDEANVSFIEKSIQNLNDELQTLNVDYDKLTVLYKDKCNKLEEIQVQKVKIADASIESASKQSEHRIEQIQNHIDRLRDGIHELKKNSTNFTTTLSRFENEKVNLLNEIDTLKATNEELQQKVSENESIAVEKTQILEKELSKINNEIQQFLTKEKEFESQKLLLEVELEELKLKEQNKNTLIDQLNEHIFSLKNELDSSRNKKNESDVSDIIENKCRDEINQQTTIRIKELEVCVDNLQTNLTKQECLCKEFQEKVFSVEKLLEEREEAKCILTQKLQAVESELIDSKSNLEIEYKNKFELSSQQYECRIKEFESHIQTLNDTLNKYVDENLNLTQELTSLRNVHGNCDTMIPEKLTESLDDIRKSIMKELKSLKCNQTSEDLSNKSVNEIFIILLQTLVLKEKEMIQTMQETFEKDKQKLVDEKKQSADTEKRVTIWAKELEAEIEKLQTELTDRECGHKEYQNKIFQLEHLLTMSTHENEVLKENLKTLETDFNNLQIEFEKQYKVDIQQEEAILIARKNEKEAQEAIKNKEIELESKIEFEKEMHEKKISDLFYTVESYKTKNLELNNIIKGLEENEKQLKNIIESNSIEIKRNTENIENINAELEQLRKVHNEVNQQLEQKTSYIEEITEILKSKCDVLSEYKIQFESITSKCEMLKEQIKQQKLTIEQYKQETKVLQENGEAQEKIIKDKLNSEVIKNTGLMKQLNKLSSNNIVLTEELNQLKEKYEELQQANMKLERKVRNSTSKIMEAELAELKNTNKQLQNDLIKASNGAAELQDIKNQTLKELMDLKHKYDLLLQENTEIKMLPLRVSKYNISNLSTDEEKHDVFLLEKNKIALELEGIKLMLNQKDDELKQYVNRVQELTDENKDLDKELDEYAAIIRERDDEISKLENKLYSCLTENTQINELNEKIKDLNEVNQKLRDQVDAFEMRLQISVEQTKDIELRETKNIICTLKKENLELQTKLNDYKKQIESTKRQFEIVTSNKNLSEYEEKCQQLMKKIHELELQLVLKNGKIATLKIQIQSESFPYQRKCKELEEHLLAFRTKNVELNSEIRKLQRTLNDVNMWECDVCRRWRVNRKDQACQTITKNTIRFCSINSGIVEDHVKIEKLEKEKALMKTLCRSRSQRIKELEARIKELE
ncbi:uncharacterized protein LOC143351460 [Colletes latitarsis]|uniref:uncharacterized protein LOC143351460 n=1 Tax=Colletes latitarsis TaxID=2605962 RepID=UPI004035887B